MSASKVSNRNGGTQIAEAKIPGNAVEQIDPKGLTALNVAEEMKLTELEEHIKRNLSGFMFIGRALKAINDDKLYRGKFKTFEEYCRERWNLSDKYSYRLIHAYTCVDALEKHFSPTGEKRFPANEYQVRPLVKAFEEKPDQWVKAWTKVLAAAKDKPITSDDVQKVVDKMLESSSTKTATKSEKGLAAKAKPKSQPAEQKLTKIAEIVTEALDADSEPTVASLTKVLVKIQSMIESKKK